MKTIKITEGNQTIVAECDLDTFEPQNEFIADLVAEAKQCGTARRNDHEGCEVTAIVKDRN